LAHRALDIDPQIGLLLPCNVVVRELEDGQIGVDFMDPRAVPQLVESPRISEIARDVQERLARLRHSPHDSHGEFRPPTG
jgi:uncharacterized protein (DUF302 family)